MYLIERDRELKQLNSTYIESVRHGGRVVVVNGPPASGKTELMRYFAGRAEVSGAKVMYAGGTSDEAGLLALARQLLSAGADLGLSLERSLDPALLTRARFDSALKSSILHNLSSILLARATHSPLVLVVDDVLLLDVFSQEWLVHLIRRAGSAKLLVLLGCGRGMLGIPPAPRLFYTEICALSRCRRLQLGTLSRAGVRAFLADRIGAPVAERFTDRCYAASGGNPSLLNALLADYEQAAPGARETDESLAFVGAAYSRRLLAILRRTEPEIMVAASALAVLGDATRPDLAGRLSGMPADQILTAVGVLTRTGILSNGRFCHPVARSAVLDAMTVDGRADAHLLAARLLRGAGADPLEIARHLVSSGRLDEVWAVPHLLDAADEALAAGRVHEVVEFLRAAYRSADDEDRRAAILARLARAEWRINPGSVHRHLPELTAAVLDGRLRGRDSQPAIAFMLLHGRIPDAMTVLARLAGDNDGCGDAETAGTLAMLRTWLPVVYPGSRPDADQRQQPIRAQVGAVGYQMSDLVRSAFRERFDNDAVAYALQVLRQHDLAEHTLVPLMTALIVLMNAERFDEADWLCARLLRSTRDTGETTWHALLCAIAARTALHRGFLVVAEENVHTALRQLATADWGVAAGLPLSTLVAAQTLLGKHAQAARKVAEPVPDAMFDTPFCLYYLLARGRHQLAVDRPRAAIEDFQECGDLIARWGFDLVHSVPWRTEIANAYLQLGDPGRATTYLHEQLRRLGSGRTRSHAVALRLLATTREPADRPGMLHEAAEIQRAGGDRLELANTLAELHRTYRLLGQSSQARLMARKAMEAARVCRADQPAPDPPRPDEGGRAATDPDGLLGADSRLTEAERRVAMLVVQGHTNGEIADKLSVSTSTVEQHLTHTYRKLGVTRRSGLLTRLKPDPVDTA